MKVQGRRKRRRPKRRCVDRVNDAIKEKGLSEKEVDGRATWRCMTHRTSTPYKSGNKMKRKKVLTLDSFDF